MCSSIKKMDFFLQNSSQNENISLENAKGDLNIAEKYIESPLTASSFYSPQEINSFKKIPMGSMQINESPQTLEIGYIFFFLYEIVNGF